MAGHPFETVTADIDETFDPNLSPAENVMQIAYRKAAVARERLPSPETSVILAADTTVVLDGTPLGKPRDAEHAFMMLSELQGRSHEVYTGFTVLHEKRHVTGHAVTVVHFERIPPGEIRRYIDTMQPFDKAGSYGIQDPLLACYVSGIEGCYYNVVGLPVSRVCASLKQFFPPPGNAS